MVSLENAVEITKYSEWMQKNKEIPELEVDAESFKALFDQRDREGKTPNEKMHNFLIAYASAVKEVAEKEDCFPILEDIEKKLQDVDHDIKERVENPKSRRKVDILKARFLENTNFFYEEEGQKNYIHLIPRAQRFKNKSGKYSNLFFDFKNGKVTLPELKPTSVDLQKELASDVQKVVDETKLDGEGVGKQIEEPKIEPEKQSRTKSVLKFGLIALILIILAFLIFAPPDKSALKGENVMYSIYDSKDEGGDFLMVELSNPDGVSVNSMIVLPKEIDKMISVEGGTVSIVHSNITTVGLSTDKDARIKIYTAAIENIPLSITHKFKGNAVPSVYGINNYTVMEIKDKVQLNFEFKNSTSIKIRIEQ